MSTAPAVSAEKLYSVVIVEDEAILALSLERSLREFRLEVRGVAATAEAAIALADRERPDVVLMDIRIQGARDGIEAADVIRSRHDAAVVVLTANSDPKTVRYMMSTASIRGTFWRMMNATPGSIADAITIAVRMRRRRSWRSQTT